jgi:beta-lactam-binding protein with PASTA domain
VGGALLLRLAVVALAGLALLVAYLFVDGSQQPILSTGTVRVVVVPELRGATTRRARAALHALGLQAAVRAVAARGRSAGTVLAQSPHPGAEVAAGSQVLLRVARGSRAVTTTAAVTATTDNATTGHAPTTTAVPAASSTTVPELAGLDELGVARALGRAGLLASLAFVGTSDPLGRVEAQHTAPGTTLPYHSHIQVDVSTGPHSHPVPVPDLIGESLQAATQTAAAAHLCLIYLHYPVTSHAQAGTIVQQTPPAHSRAPQNAQLIVYLGN